MIECRNLARGGLVISNSRLCEILNGLVFIVQIDIRPSHLCRGHGLLMLIITTQL